MDGTLYRGEEPIPGAAEFIAGLQSADIPFLLVTNCPEHSPKELSEKLSRMGMEVPTERIVTSGVAAVMLLQQRGYKTAYIVGSPALFELAHKAGIIHTEENPQCVLLGQDRALNFDKLDRAAVLIAAGLPFICTNPDASIPYGGRRMPHTGAAAAFLATATGVTPEFVGKPQPFMARLACEWMGCAPEELTVVGDNLRTDILWGNRSGARTCLIQTGISAGEAPAPEMAPTCVFPDLPALMETDGIPFPR